MMAEHYRYERLSIGNDVRDAINEDIEVRHGTISMEMNPKSTAIHSKLLQLAIGTLGLILLYLSLSICLTFYQGWLLKDMKFPLSIICYHLFIKLLLSAVIRWLYKLTSGKSRVSLDFKTSVKKMALTGFASGIDIGFSNWGLELVKISLYTMTKSSTIIFILIFAIILRLEKKSWSLFLIVVMISGGLFMFTYKSTQFDAFGFAFVLFASLASGIRWTFAQLIMQKSKLGLHNPVDMMYHMQPWMILSVLPFAIAFEKSKVLEALSEIPKSTYENIIYVLIKISTGAFIAFIMEISEFLVLSYTSSLTLSISGIFKDICQLALAVEFNGDQLSLTNIIGLMLCIGGICCHVLHKYSQMSSEKNENEINSIRSKIEIQSNPIDTLRNSNCVNKKVLLRRNSGQNIPLLNTNGENENSCDTDDEIDDSQNDDNQDANDVIFDILKRRDPMTR